VGPDEGPLDVRVVVGPEGAQGLQGAGVQGYGGGSVLAWTAGQGFGAALAGPASGIEQRLGMHTSVALVAVTMLGWPPVSELGSSMPLGPWNPGLIWNLPEEWMGLRA